MEGSATADHVGATAATIDLDTMEDDGAEKGEEQVATIDLDAIEDDGAEKVEEKVATIDLDAMRRAHQQRVAHEAGVSSSPSSPSGSDGAEISAPSSVSKEGGEGEDKHKVERRLSSELLLPVDIQVVPVAVSSDGRATSDFSNAVEASSSGQTIVVPVPNPRQQRNFEKASFQEGPVRSVLVFSCLSHCH
jgi:hypothetical protein